MKNSQMKVMFLFLLLTAAMPLFADLVPTGLTSMSTEIVEVFTGGLVRTILICCLAGCAVAYGFNKDNEKMKRNIIAIGIAIIVIVGASGIVEAVWKAAK